MHKIHIRPALRGTDRIRSLRYVQLLAVSLLVGGSSLVGTSPSGATPSSPSSTVCITRSSPTFMGPCPLGSPQVVAFSASQTLFPTLAATAAGAVYTDDAGSLPGMNGKKLNAPIVGMATTYGPYGYYLVAADGGVFAFNTSLAIPYGRSTAIFARFYGSVGGQPLDAPIVGMAVTNGGEGYYLVAADGGVFAFGDAVFRGSMGGQHLNAPIVGMGVTPTGTGYWLVAADGGVFTFGDAKFYGSMGGQHINAPVTGITSRTGGGYSLVAADGGIFTFGHAAFSGSAKGYTTAPMIGIYGLAEGSIGYSSVWVPYVVSAAGDEFQL